jgi:hypothetical protein
LNPEYPEHIPNYPDYPERRAIASAPVVGGANLPRPPIEPNFPQAVHSAPNVPLVEPSRPSTSDASPFYFLNDFTAPSSSSSEFDAANFATAQSFQLPHGDALKSLLQQDTQVQLKQKIMRLQAFISWICRNTMRVTAIINLHSHSLLPMPLSPWIFKRSVVTSPFCKNASMVVLWSGLTMQQRHRNHKA